MTMTVGKAELEKKIASYEQQAELMLANFNRLKGAAAALREMLGDTKEPSPNGKVKEKVEV